MGGCGVCFPKWERVVSHAPLQVSTWSKMTRPIRSSSEQCYGAMRGWGASAIGLGWSAPPSPKDIHDMITLLKILSSLLLREAADFKRPHRDGWPIYFFGVSPLCVAQRARCKSLCWAIRGLTPFARTSLYWYIARACRSFSNSIHHLIRSVVCRHRNMHCKCVCWIKFSMFVLHLVDIANYHKKGVILIKLVTPRSFGYFSHPVFQQQQIQKPQHRHHIMFFRSFVSSFFLPFLPSSCCSVVVLDGLNAMDWAPMALTAFVDIRTIWNKSDDMNDIVIVLFSNCVIHEQNILYLCEGINHHSTFAVR